MRPQTQRAGRPVVLHLTSTASQRSEQFNRAIADSGALCVQAHNVYEALARTVQPHGQDAPDTVLVCLDSVTDAELEFFELVHRCRPELALYVYASGPDASRAEPLANQHLASSVVPSEMPSVLDALRADSANDGWGRPEPTAAPPAEGTAPPEQPCEPLEAATEPVTAGVHDDQQSDLPVQPHQAAKPPTRRPPSAPDSHPVEDHPDVLLTQEELAALLGRDGHTDSQEPQP
ncbi:MAG TPA: hypothetical protein VMZ31_16120 [Phycisphaerae bacterium]|nr:hypothetical protein [Phycisphaerae bacterium]